MAKVKTAKEKITAVLKAKGFDTAEIKDAFDELDSADVDLTRLASELADVTTKNSQWVNEFYPAAVKEYQTVTTERDTLKKRLDGLEKAGVKFSDEPTQKQTEQAPNGQWVSPADLEKFKQQLIGANSAVLKNGLKLSFQHYKKFSSDVNWDEVEQLMADGKASNMEDAYRLWSKPQWEKATKDETDKLIAEGIKKGVQDEVSKLGISGRVRKQRGDGVEQELLTKASTQKSYKDMAPEEKRAYDNSLRDGFVSDINTDVTH